MLHGTSKLAREKGAISSHYQGGRRGHRERRGRLEAEDGQSGGDVARWVGDPPEEGHPAWEAAERSVNHLSYLECGERLPSLQMLLRVAKALGTTGWKLLEERQDDPEFLASWMQGFLAVLPPAAQTQLFHELSQTLHGTEAPPREAEPERGRGRRKRQK